MNRASTSFHPPLLEIRQIENPCSANGCVELLNQDLVQLQGSGLRALQIILRFEGCVMVYYSTSSRVRTRPKLIDDHVVGILTFGPNATGSINGIPIQTNQLLAFSNQASLGLVVNPQYESLAFLIRPEMQATLNDRYCKSAATPSNRLTLLQSPANMAGALYRWGKSVVDEVISDPLQFQNSKAYRQAVESELVDQIGGALSCTFDWAPARSERICQQRSSIVQTAERFALAHTGEKLYLTDLCKVTGVSERTLEYSFRSVMGISPIAYLTKLRLRQVHHALLNAQPGTTTVTQQALNWGFWHFGEFSRAYRDCFDELPSDTLRRVPLLL